MEVEGPVAAFVPRRQRQRWDRRERRERDEGYRTQERVLPVIKPIQPVRRQSVQKKQSIAKDMDDMDNIEDFFDSDTEYPTDNISIPIDIPTPNDVVATLASEVLSKAPPPAPVPTPQKKPAVYTRTPKFTPGNTKPSRKSSVIKTPQLNKFSPIPPTRISLMSPSESTETYEESSEYAFPLPPIPPTPGKEANPSEINLESLPFSPPQKLNSEKIQVDLNAIEMTMAADMKSTTPKSISKPKSNQKENEEIIISSAKKRKSSVKPSPQSIKPVKSSNKKKNSVQPKKKNNNRTPLTTINANRPVITQSMIASPFSATLLETNLMDDSPTRTKSFLSESEDEEMDDDSLLSISVGKPSTKKVSISSISGSSLDESMESVRGSSSNDKSHRLSTLLEETESEVESPLKDPSVRSIMYDPSVDVDPDDFVLANDFKLSEIDSLSVGKLKKILKFYELPVYGRKSEMVERLKKHFVDKRAGRKRVDSLAPTPSPVRRRSSLIDGDEPTVGMKRKRITRTKPLEYWNNERVIYSRQKRKSGDFATVVDLIREPETSSNCLPPSKRRKYREEPFPSVPVYSTAQDKDVKFHAVKNQSMLKWSALSEQEESVSSDITTYSNSSEKQGHPIHHTFAFNNDFFATGQLEVAPKSQTPMQNSRGSHEFYYVTAGTAEVFINKDTFIMKRGCHFYVPPVNDYYIKNPNASSYLSLVFFRSTEYDDKDESLST